MMLVASPHSFDVLSDFAGVSRRTIHGWRQQKKTPNIEIFQAVLAALGYKLVIVPISNPHVDPLNQ